MAALDAYLSGRGTEIRTEEYAIRVSKLVLEYLTAKSIRNASVAIWTPSRQIDFAKSLFANYQHSASTIRRTFTVIAAAFADAAKVKIRIDPLGQEIEGSLMSHAPSFSWTEDEIRAELQMPASKKTTFVPTLDEMARFVDALESEHLRRWALLAMATWARPEAITDFDPYIQWDRRTNQIDLDPPGRAQTNKRRAKIVCCRTLSASLEEWMKPRTYDKDKRYPFETIERPALLLYKREPVGTVKKAVKRIADEAGLPDITQKTPRTFMATMVRKLCPNVSREKRSMWLGHIVQEGSRTTDHYEISDPEYLSDVALATDYVLQQIRQRCRSKSFAVEILLNRADLARIGAVPISRKRQ